MPLLSVIGRDLKIFHFMVEIEFHVVFIGEDLFQCRTELMNISIGIQSTEDTRMEPIPDRR